MANKSNDERKAEVVEQVSTLSSLYTTNDSNDNDNATDTQEVGWKSRLDKSMISLEQQTREFNKKLQPQMSSINKLINAELNDMQTKESQLGEQFKNKLDEYKKVSLFTNRRRVTFIYFFLFTHSPSPQYTNRPRNNLNSSRRNIVSLLRIQSY